MSLRVVKLALLAVLCAAVSFSCSRTLDEALPPETDLYAYSLAVAQRAMRRAPHNAALGLFHLGKVHERFGLEDRALELYREALELDPNLGEAHRSTGFILSQRKDRMPEAIDAYQQALRTDPDTPGTLSRMGLVFMHMTRLDDALVCINEEIRGDTADQDTYYNKGRTLGLLLRHDEAVACFKEAIKRAPEMLSAHYALAQSLRAVGRTEEAEESEKNFRELKKVEEQAAAARSGLDSNREDLLGHASKTWLDAAALLAEESIHVKGDPGLLAAVQRDYVAALRESKRLTPRDLEASKALVEYFRKAGDIATAARECSEALTASPNEAGFAPAAFHLSMELLEGLPRNASPGDPRIKFSQQLIEQALKAKPDLAEGHRELARLILFRLEPTKENFLAAAEHARTAVKISPEAMNYDILALAYFKGGRLDLARDTLEEGVQRNPQDATLKKRLDDLRQKTQGN